MAEAAEEPGYAADESTKEGYVRVKVKIPKLKVKSQDLLGFFKKHPHPKAKNADIQIPTYLERGFSLEVHGHGTGEMKGSRHKLSIAQLPHAIDPDKCYIEAEDGWVFLFLKKSDENQSWEKHIRDGNLETGET